MAVPRRSAGAADMICAVFAGTNAPLPRPVTASAMTTSSSGEVAPSGASDSTASVSTTNPTVRGMRVPTWSESVPASGAARTCATGCAAMTRPVAVAESPRPWMR